MGFFGQFDEKPVVQFKRACVFVAIWAPASCAVWCVFKWFDGKTIDVVHELLTSLAFACFVAVVGLLGSDRRQKEWMVLNQRRASIKRDLEAALHQGQLKAASKKNHGVV